MATKQKKRPALADSEKNYRIIGVAGAGSGTGTTHFSIMMASYLTGICREKTAVLEWERCGSLAELERVCIGKNKEVKPFRAVEADYFKEADSSDLKACMEYGYQTVVIDFGVLTTGQRDFFYRCDITFLVGSLSEWQIACFLQEADTILCRASKTRCLAVFGNEESRIRMRRKLNIAVERIPFRNDAFLINHEIIDFFEHIL